MTKDGRNDATAAAAAVDEKDDDDNTRYGRVGREAKSRRLPRITAHAPNHVGIHSDRDSVIFLAAIIITNCTTIKGTRAQRMFYSACKVITTHAMPAIYIK